MSPSMQDLLAQLDAEKCIGCCMQRSKILKEALTYCRIPGYVQPCADDGWSPLLIATGRCSSRLLKSLSATSVGNRSAHTSRCNLSDSRQTLRCRLRLNCVPGRVSKRSLPFA